MAHQQFGIAGATYGSSSIYGDQAGERGLYHLYAFVDAALHDDVSIAYAEYLFGIGDLRYAQSLGHL